MISRIHGIEVDPRAGNIERRICGGVSEADASRLQSRRNTLNSIQIPNGAVALERPIPAQEHPRLPLARRLRRSGIGNR